MRRTRFFLIAGCACILALEARSTGELIAEAWRGPYASAEAQVRSAAVQPAAVSPELEPCAAEPALEVARN